MAPSTQSFFLLSFSALLLLRAFSNAQTLPKSQAFKFPISKDATTNQYYTTIQTVIDLAGKFTWFYSLDYFNAASSYRPILCGTQDCRIAKGFGCIFCFNSPPFPGCANNSCSDYALNPFTGTQGYSGLGQDVLRVYSTRGHRYNLNNFPFQYSDPYLLQGLASPTTGLIGLGRTRIALQSQLALTFKIPQKFALCIPSLGNKGNLIIGQGIYSNPFQEIATSLITTYLIRNRVRNNKNNPISFLTVEYFINLMSIRVDNKILSFNNSLLSIDKKTGAGGTSLHTSRAYTSLVKPIFMVLVNEFVKAARSKNIKSVASVAPFGACFDARTIGSVKTGPQVPIIDFVLRRKNVYWRFYGSNSMVSVGNGVTCLAFVEETPNLVGSTTSVVVGGYQMENHLLEFDVDSSRLGISPSLLLRDTSCSQFIAS